MWSLTVLLCLFNGTIRGKKAVNLEGHILTILVDVSTAMNRVYDTISYSKFLFIRSLKNRVDLRQGFKHGGWRVRGTKHVVDCLRSERYFPISAATRYVASELSSARHGSAMKACDSVILKLSSSFTKRLKSSNMRIGSAPLKMCFLSFMVMLLI